LSSAVEPINRDDVADRESRSAAVLCLEIT
jgi:hypothetical protein